MLFQVSFYKNLTTKTLFFKAFNLVLGLALTLKISSSMHKHMKAAAEKITGRALNVSIPSATLILVHSAVALRYLKIQCKRFFTS